MRQATTGAAALADPSQKAKRQGDAAFRGAFSINAAIAVATDGRITATDAIEGVANLAEKSFPTTDITGNITHHPLLDTTRVYALEKLTESGEVDDVARRRRRVLPRYVRAGAARCQACRGLDLQP